MPREATKTKLIEPDLIVWLFGSLVGMNNNTFVCQQTASSNPGTQLLQLHHYCRKLTSKKTVWKTTTMKRRVVFPVRTLLAWIHRLKVYEASKPHTAWRKCRLKQTDTLDLVSKVRQICGPFETAKLSNVLFRGVRTHSVSTITRTGWLWCGAGGRHELLPEGVDREKVFRKNAARRPQRIAMS